MKSLIAVPDTKPIAEHLFADFQTFFYDGWRFDLSEVHEDAWAQIRQVAAHPELFPILLLAHGSMRRLSGAPWNPDGLRKHVEDTCIKLRDTGLAGRELGIEIGNEPDIAHDFWKNRPEVLGSTWRECRTVIRSYSERWLVLSPSISNLNDRGFRYLEKMNLPKDAEVAFHRYPAGRNFWDSHARTRGAEIERLQTLAHGARLWNTETGWAEQNGGYELTEIQVAERTKDEAEYWQNAGCESFTQYQINDGAWDENSTDDHKRLSTYGIRRVDGTWKPSASSVKVAKLS